MRILDDTYDVVVVGGGMAGYAAALTLSDRGWNTLIVERRPVLGWEGTWAFALDAAEMSSVVGQRILAAVEAAGGRRDDRLDAPILEMTLDRLATAAGLHVLYYATPLGLVRTSELVTGVRFGWKGGEFTLRGKAVVDATENGLLWREAGQPVQTPADTASRYAVYANNIAESLEPVALGTLGEAAEVTVTPGVWPGEAAVEFTVAADLTAARLLVPAVLQAVKEQMPALAPALVTHAAYEVMPLTHPVSLEETRGVSPGCANLFGAGLWTGTTQRPATLGTRLAQGERTGEVVHRTLPTLPQPEAATASEQSLSAPPEYTAEVVVCGGGTAGALAGIAAAREGADTTLLEAGTFLGGIGAGGGIHSYYHGVTGGIQDELDGRVADLTSLFSGAGKAQGFHPEAKKVVLEQMAAEAGGRVVYGTTVTGVQIEPVGSSLPAKGTERPAHRITGVVAAGPEGGALFKARVVIDATGDGDVAVKAGAPFTHGREKDELTHACSQPGGILGEGGVLTIVNFDSGYCDPSDLEDLTRARRVGVSHFFRDHYAPRNRLLYIAPLLGLRNSRQIAGDYRLTLADEIEGREFPDVVAYAYSHFDNHGYDYENESDEAAVWVWLLGNWRRQFGCEIPYRCLLPRNVEGLLVACRALSLTHDAHNQLRMQRDMQRLGQVAGVAAAQAVKAGTPPRGLNVPRLQQRLFELGDLGPRERPQLPPSDTTDLPVHRSDWKPDPLPMKPVDELAADLAGDNPRSVVWQLLRTGRKAVPALLQAVHETNPQKRLWASFVLAAAGRGEAAPELIRCVETRRTDDFEAHKAAPLYQTAVILLGRLGSAAAVPVLVDLLTDPEPSLDLLIAVVRALGRIGDPQAVEPLETLLTRTDLPTTRSLQISTPVVSRPVTEDCRWQLELAVAESLGRLGRARPELAEEYLNDDRAYVRRYARKVLRELKT